MNCRLLIFLVALGVALSPGRATAQPDTSSRNTTPAVYRVSRPYELTGSVLFLGASYFGFRALDRYASLTAEDIAKLDPDRINRFDRPVAFFDPRQFDKAQQRSDLLLNISIASPLLLALSKRARHDGIDLAILYTTTHSVNNLIYFATTFSIRRARPLTYNPGLAMAEKTGEAKSNSFFSGHVSFSATATFFGAKVLTDYYRIRGWKRIGVFTLAAIPPVLVGVNRMQAGKHFRTDVLTGFLVGAACGIGVPEFHKRWAARSGSSAFSWTPEFSPGRFSGLSLRYRIQ